MSKKKDTAPTQANSVQSTAEQLLKWGKLSPEEYEFATGRPAPAEDKGGKKP